MGMRLPDKMGMTRVATLAPAMALAAVIGYAVAAEPRNNRPLRSAEMQSARGLQGGGGGGDYECFSNMGGCCQGLQCGLCPDCYACTDDVGSIEICSAGSGTCTELPDHDCGELVQGECIEPCEGDDWCEMTDTIVLGSCGTISQCE